MQQEKQEKKKTDKKRDPMKHSQYRTRAAKRLRKLAGKMPKATAEELQEKARKLESGAKRHHHKVSPWMVRKALNIKTKGWDVLHPDDEEVHRPLVAVICILEVSTMGRMLKSPSCPIVGVAWNERVRGTRKNDPVIPDAPMSAVAQVGELDSTVFRLY